MAIVKFLIEECNCGTEEKTHVRMCAHACMHALRVCVCICMSVCVHFLTGHPVACTLCMCKRSALSYCSMFVCTCMCACPSVYIVCILYNPFLVTVWRQLAPFCCATSSKRSSQVPCGRARCQCERQKYSMCHAKHNALCCELIMTVCVHMVMVIITWCIRMYVQHVH